LSLPLTHSKEPGSISAYAEPDPLKAFLQREQWQHRALRSGAVIS